MTGKGIGLSINGTGTKYPYGKKKLYPYAYKSITGQLKTLNYRINYLGN